MLTLLGSLLGFGTSFLPKVMDFFQRKQDNAHELAIIDMQMKAQSELHTQRIEEINVEGDIREMESLHRSDRDSGVRWVEALRATVRPVITYVFFAVFVTVKITGLMALLDAGDAIHVAMDAIWDQETKAIFAAVISFWFGQRAMQRFLK